MRGGATGIDNRTRGKIPLENAREARGYVSSRGRRGRRRRASRGERGQKKGVRERERAKLAAIEGVEPNSIKFQVSVRLSWRVVGEGEEGDKGGGQRVPGEISWTT